MKRFLKISVLLVVSLFVLVSGVNATLDHYSHSITQSSFTLYNDKGVVVAYTGDLTQCKVYNKLGPATTAATPSLLHRT